MKQAGTNSRIEYFRAHMEEALERVPSGATRWLGGKLTEVGRGRLVAEFVVREDMVNPMKTLHGGAAAMIMDDMLGIMVYLLGNGYAHTSVNLNCDFLSAARIGTRLIATAKVVREGRNIVHGECEIRDSEQKLIAKSTSNLVLTAFPLEDEGRKEKESV